MTASAFDIAVVGGGVAGSAAALTAAATGRSVALIAPSADAADRFGEFLSPAANELIRELGLTEALAAGPHRAATTSFTAWGSDMLVERNAMLHVEGSGHVLNRPAFERVLRHTAVQRVRAVCGDHVESAVLENDQWRLRLADSSSINARFVLDCSGRAATVARHHARRRQEDGLIAVGAFLTQQDDSIEPTPATLIEAESDGWWYASLLPDRRLTVALFSDSDLLPPKAFREVAQWRARIDTTHYIRRWIESAGFSVDALPRRASATTTWLEPAIGSRWAAAGDAAAAFDPLSSHGLTTALWGGRRAALAAHAALDGDDGLLGKYGATLRKGVQDFLTQRHAIYRRERRWSGRPFWQRRQHAKF